MTSKGACILVATVLMCVSAQAQTDLANLEFCNPTKPEYTRAYRRAGVLDAYKFIAALQPQTSSVQVGVVDGPVNRNHIEFVGVNLDVSGIGNGILSSVFSHGTSVSGIIGANNLGLSKSCSGTNGLQMNGVLSGAGVSYKVLAIGQVVFLPESGARALDELGKAGVPVVKPQQRIT